MVRDSAIVALGAIIALSVINMVALMNGIDAQLTTTIAGLIGGIAGYYFKSLKNRVACK